MSAKQVVAWITANWKISLAVLVVLIIIGGWFGPDVVDSMGQEQ